MRPELLSKTQESLQVQKDRAAEAISCRRSTVSYDNVYTKKPKFRRKLIEKYSTAWYNINTRLICVVPETRAMKPNSRIQFRQLSAKRRLRSSVKDGVEELPLPSVESDSRSSSTGSSGGDVSQNSSSPIVSSPSAKSGAARAGVKRKNSMPVADAHIESLSADEPTNSDGAQKKSGRRSSARRPPADATTAERTVASDKSRTDEDRITVGGDAASSNAASADCATNSSAGSAVHRTVKTCQLVSNQFYAYLLEKCKEGSAANPTKRRKRKSIVVARKTKTKAQSSSVVSYADPYSSSWMRSNETDVPKTDDEDVRLLVHLGVGRPLFPLVHRNIVTLGGARDPEITDIWAEFALSTLVTAPSDRRPKPVLLPVKDPRLLAAVVDFNREWPATYERLELRKAKKSCGLVPVSRSEEKVPVRPLPAAAAQLADGAKKVGPRKPRKTADVLSVEQRKCLRNMPTRQCKNAKPDTEVDVLVADSEFDDSELLVTEEKNAISSLIRHLFTASRGSTPERPATPDGPPVLEAAMPVTPEKAASLEPPTLEAIKPVTLEKLVALDAPPKLEAVKPDRSKRPFAPTEPPTLEAVQPAKIRKSISCDRVAPLEKSTGRGKPASEPTMIGKSVASVPTTIGKSAAFEPATIWKPVTSKSITIRKPAPSRRLVRLDEPAVLETAVSSTPSIAPRLSARAASITPRTSAARGEPVTSVLSIALETIDTTRRSTTPVEQIAPAKSAAILKLVTPEKPVTLVKPATPVEPAKSDEPPATEELTLGEKPIVLGRPSTPEKSVTPLKLVTPVNEIVSEEPTAHVTPDTPKQLSIPGKPLTPMKSAATEKLATLENPATTIKLAVREHTITPDKRVSPQKPSTPPKPAVLVGSTTLEDPVAPSESIPPVKPAVPRGSTSLEDQVTPPKPATPVKLAATRESTTFEDQVTPSNTTTPVKPAVLEGSTTLEDQVTPSKSSTPVKPADLKESITPNDQGTPSKLTAPVQPAVNTPEKQVTPPKPTTPVQSVALEASTTLEDRVMLSKSTALDEPATREPLSTPDRSCEPVNPTDKQITAPAHIEHRNVGSAASSNAEGLRSSPIADLNEIHLQSSNRSDKPADVPVSDSEIYSPASRRDDVQGGSSKSDAAPTERCADEALAPSTSNDELCAPAVSSTSDAFPSPVDFSSFDDDDNVSDSLFLDDEYAPVAINLNSDAVAVPISLSDETIQTSALASIPTDNQISDKKMNSAQARVPVPDRAVWMSTKPLEAATPLTRGANASPVGVSDLSVPTPTKPPGAASRQDHDDEGARSATSIGDQSAGMPAEPAGGTARPRTGVSTRHRRTAVGRNACASKPTNGCGEQKYSPTSGRNKKSCERFCCMSPPRPAHRGSLAGASGGRTAHGRSTAPPEPDDVILRRHGYRPCWVSLPRLEDLLYDRAAAVAGSPTPVARPDPRRVVAASATFTVRRNLNEPMPTTAHPTAVARVADAPPIVDVVDEDHFFGFDHSTRTYGPMIDYRLRNRSSVYFYKMKRMLNFQKKNNRHFQTCRYHRVYNSMLLEEVCLVDVVSDEVDEVGGVLATPRCRQLDRICGPSFVAAQMSEDEVEARKRSSRNPLDVLQSPAACRLVGLGSQEECGGDPPKNQVSIHFVDNALLKQETNQKWILLQLNQRVACIVFAQTNMLPAKLLFDVIYRADLTKKVVCHAIETRRSRAPLKFGVYGIPGLCSAVIVGPYDPREQSHLLEAILKNDVGADIVIPIRTIGEVNGLWWRPKVGKSRYNGDTNLAYLNFVFKSSHYKQSHSTVRLNDLLRRHEATKYCVFGGPLESNFVLLHDQPNGELATYNYVPLLDPETGPPTVGKAAEYKYVSLTDDVFSAFEPRDTAPPKCSLPAEEYAGASLEKFRFYRRSKRNNPPPEMTSEDSCGSSRSQASVLSERLRRKEFSAYRYNLYSSITGEDPLLTDTSRDASLISILNKATEVLRSVNEDSEALLREEERLKQIRKQLIYKFAVLLRSADSSSSAYKYGKKFLSELTLPKRASAVVEQFNSFLKSSSSSGPLPLDECIQTNQMYEDARHQPERTGSSGSLAADSVSRPAVQLEQLYEIWGGRRRPAKKEERSLTKSQLEEAYPFEFPQGGPRITGKKHVLKTVTTEPPYVEHSYSRVTVDPLSGELVPDARSRGCLLPLGSAASRSSATQLGRSFSFVKAPDVGDTSSDQSNQISVFLTENEKPISKIVINQLKSVSDKKELPPAERRRQIVTLIRRILHEMDSKYQGKDLRRQEEKRSLVSRLQLLQRMLLGVNVNRKMSKTRVIGEIEISDDDDDEDITILSDDKKYSCRIQHSVASRTSKREFQSEMDYAAGSESWDIRGVGNQYYNFENTVAANPILDSWSRLPDFEENRWAMRWSAPKANACMVEESPFIENEVPCSELSEPARDWSFTFSARRNFDELATRKKGKSLLPTRSDNSLQTIPILRKVCPSDRVTSAVNVKQKYTPMILKRPGRNGATNYTIGGHKQVGDAVRNEFYIPDRRHPESTFQIPETRIHCPSFVPEVKPARIRAPEANATRYVEDDVIKVVRPEVGTSFVLPDEPVPSNCVAFVQHDDTLRKGSPELILPDENACFFGECIEASKSVDDSRSEIDGDDRSSSTNSAQRDANDSGNESDMPYRLSVRPFASLVSFNNRILSNIDRLLKF